MSNQVSSPPKRRRRSPQAAAKEILAAAEELIAERPFRELSVDDVMARTTLSRSSFYVYFRDRYDLLIRLVGEIEVKLQAMNEEWLSAGRADDPRERLQAALSGVVGAYENHGRVMRAIADAAAADPQIETLYDAMLARFVELNAAKIREQQGSGLIPKSLDARETARALVWMTERFLVRSGVSGRADRQRMEATLASVWSRTLYGG